MFFLIFYLILLFMPYEKTIAASVRLPFHEKNVSPNLKKKRRKVSLLNACILRKETAFIENSNKQANKRHFCCTCPQDKGYRSLPRRWSVKVCARAPLAKRPMTSPEQSGLCLSGEWEFQCVDETPRGTFSSTQLGVVRRTKLLSSGTNCWIFFWWKQLK